MRKKWIIFFILLLNIGCAFANVNDYQRAKNENDLLVFKSKLLDTKYVGFTKEDFISDFGQPESVMIDEYPYSLDVDCLASDCATGIADELLTFTFVKKEGIRSIYYSVYAYVESGIIVRIR